MKEHLIEIRCRSCRRIVGIGPADFRIYCDGLCSVDYPAVENEARDALIEAIYLKTHKPKTALARDFSVSRQRVDQILERRLIS